MDMRKCFWMLAAILVCCITNVQAAEVSEVLQKSVDNNTDNGDSYGTETDHLKGIYIHHARKFVIK